MREKIKMTVDNTDNSKNIGLYIHIPFCVKKCNYCDFYSVNCENEVKISEYIDLLCGHISNDAGNYSGKVVDSIFIGGGTPSIAPSAAFAKLSETIKNNFRLAQSAEFSVEANPGTLSREKLICYRQSGVNRLSIGLQSTDENILKVLGRIHTLKDFKNNFLLARENGFDNISVDIMYGLPTQSTESFSETLRHVCDFNPEHVSAYCLKIEENTPFFNIKESLDLPGEEEEYEMYLSLCKILESAGYKQYEISNFSKNGHRCRHNLRYWQGGEYVGFGPSAHSFYKGERYYYSNDIKTYAASIKEGKSPKKIPENTGVLYKNDSIDEYIMLRMRLSDGVNVIEFLNKFKIPFDNYCSEIRKYIDSGHVEFTDSAYRFTAKGFFVSNFILADILHFSEV